VVHKKKLRNTDKEDINNIFHFYTSEINQNFFNIYRSYYFILKSRLLSYIKFLFGIKKRSTKKTEIIYNKSWNKKDNKKWFSPKENLTIHYHNQKKVLASSGLTQRIWQNIIIKKIMEIRPKNILEVGSGNGINSFLIASCFKNIKITGIDFSNNGIIKSNELLKTKKFDKNFYQPLKFKFNKKKINNLNFMKMNAKNLKFTNGSFDFIFTILALEQMNGIHLQVIKEIKRCAKKHIILIEPFKNLNLKGLSYLHHKSNDYLNLNYKDLECANFKINEYQYKYPNKISLNVGMVHLKKTL